MPESEVNQYGIADCNGVDIALVIPLNFLYFQIVLLCLISMFAPMVCGKVGTVTMQIHHVNKVIYGKVLFELI